VNPGNSLWPDDRRQMTECRHLMVDVRRTMKWDINDGSDMIKLNTTNSDIIIKMLNE
jgi:hypothetical protein